MEAVALLSAPIDQPVQIYELSAGGAIEGKSDMVPPRRRQYGIREDIIAVKCEAQFLESNNYMETYVSGGIFALSNDPVLGTVGVVCEINPRLERPRLIEQFQLRSGYQQILTLGS